GQDHVERPADAERREPARGEREGAHDEPASGAEEEGAGGGAEEQGQAKTPEVGGHSPKGTGDSPSRERRGPRAVLPDYHNRGPAIPARASDGGRHGHRLRRGGALARAGLTGLGKSQ